MDNVVLIAFLTGLTAGGLSCFAVQGGLLSGSIAQRLEQRLISSSDSGKRATAGRAGIRSGKAPSFQIEMLQPILLFTSAKLLAYTLLGFLLGWLGSMFSFSPMMQGMVQIAIGVFLVGNALRMFNVHPIFRYFSFEPPSALTRYIRKVSKGGDAWVTPVFLGALTVLIPCGVTQTMMALAVGTGNAMLGGVILFAFVLGSSPTFIGISWLATSLGGLFQKYFYAVTAVIVLGLGLYSLNSGLVLSGSPVSATRLLQSKRLAVAAPASTQNPSPVNASSGAFQARIDVENYGYKPDLLTLPANQPIELHLVTNKTRSCSQAFVIPTLKISEYLPNTGDTVITLPPQPTGTTIQFMCSMGMYTGVFQFR